MAPKRVKEPEPPPVEEAPPPQDLGPPEERLEGEFIFPDGSTYSGEYLKILHDVILHGDGTLITGPESFKGTFERGLYKAGKFTACSGAEYNGAFRDNLFHGFGEYRWTNGRAYKGTWKDGFMHGRGLFTNFSFGVNTHYTGFSVNGRFASSREEQEELRAKFLHEYCGACTASAIAALTAIDGEHGAKALAELIIPPSVAHEDAEEKPDKPADVETRALAAQVVDGPFPSDHTLSLPLLQAFVAGLVDGAEKKVNLVVLEDKSLATALDGQRLKHEMLQYVGQCLELSSLHTEVGQISSIVLVNISKEWDVASAKWKLVQVHIEEAKTPG